MLKVARERELIRLCQEFVRLPSTSGNERQMATFVRDTMLSMGFSRADVDSYGNVTGSVVLGEEGNASFSSPRWIMSMLPTHLNGICTPSADSKGMARSTEEVQPTRKAAWPP